MVLALAHEYNGIKSITLDQGIKVVWFELFAKVNWLIVQVTHTDGTPHLLDLPFVSLATLDVLDNLELNYRRVVYQLVQPAV